jgi:hypothetical protein
MKKPKGWRTITIEDEKWLWRVGRGNVSILDPYRSHFYVDFTTLTGIEDTERAAWKGYLQIKPSHIRNYIDVHLRDRKETNIDIVAELKKIFAGERYAEYIGGTLTFKTEDNMIMLNVGQGETEEEKVWIALNYIKHRKGRFRNAAIDIVRGREDYRKELAKALIKVSEEG